MLHIYCHLLYFFAFFLFLQTLVNNIAWNEICLYFPNLTTHPHKFVFIVNVISTMFCLIGFLYVKSTFKYLTRKHHWQNCAYLVFSRCMSLQNIILINGVCVIMPNRVLVKLAFSYVFVFCKCCIILKCRKASLLLLFSNSSFRKQPSSVLKEQYK